jgi:hypothetical protein
MIPILHSPGVIIPGQLGPIILDLELFRATLTLTISIIGIPSVIQTIRGICASIHSNIASAANGGGTNIIAAFASVLATASKVVLKTGCPS